MMPHLKSFLLATLLIVSVCLCGACFYDIVKEIL